jgi:hypothetical protein
MITEVIQMFDIIIPNDTEVKLKVDNESMTNLLIEGITYDCIDELHSAVEYVNAFTEANVSGADVEGLLNKIVKELTSMSSGADVMARDNKTVTEMAKEITGEYFSFDDIKAFKIEMYGSVIAWKQEMA